MKREVENSLRSFLVEFVMYACLVAAYYFLVLQYLGPWLTELFKTDRQVYSWVALGLIIGQGIMLDFLTQILLAFIRPRTEE